jgi:hypothetical protein
MHLSNRPAFYSVSLEEIETKWQAPLFKTALRRYISLQNNPELNAVQLEKSLWDIIFPFRALPVWKMIKFLYLDPIMGRKCTVDAIHANPEQRVGRDRNNRHICGHFDTALVNDGSGKKYGMGGMSIH